VCVGEDGRLVGGPHEVLEQYGSEPLRGGGARGARGVGDLERRFAYHVAGDEAQRSMAALRTCMLSAARAVDSLVPDGREKSVAVSRLEEASMWAVAGIARNQGGERGD
jgi:hypothetical protein